MLQNVIVVGTRRTLPGSATGPVTHVRTGGFQLASASKCVAETLTWPTEVEAVAEAMQIDDSKEDPEMLVTTVIKTEVLKARIFARTMRAT